MSLRKYSLMLRFLYSAIILLYCTFVAASSGAEEVMLIEGYVNEYYQLVTDDGSVFNIAETDEGNELISNVGHRVRVSGWIQKNSDGDWILFVESFLVIA